MKDAWWKVKEDAVLAPRALFVTCTRGTTLHSRHMKNALVFSQLDARYFSMYIVTPLTRIFIVSSSLPISFQRYFCLLFALLSILTFLTYIIVNSSQSVIQLDRNAAFLTPSRKVICSLI